MRRHWIALLSAWAIGCGGGSSSNPDLAESVGPPPSGGAFGNAEVRPECGTFSQACLKQGLDAPLAVGAALGLAIDYDIAGSAAPELTLSAANPEVIGVEGAVIVGEGEGSSSLLIMSPEQQVVDFINVWVAAADTLEVVRHYENGDVIGTFADEGTLLVGDELLMSVEAFNTTQALMGQFETTFAIEVLDGDAPVTIVDDVVFGFHRLAAREPGRVRVTLQALKRSHEIEIEVLP
jgi:hypothetical protein